MQTLTVIEPAAFWIVCATGHGAARLAQAAADDRALTGREITVEDLKAFLVRAGFGAPGDDFEALPGWPVWVRNRQMLSILGTLWDDTDTLARLRAFPRPVLGVKGTATSNMLAAVVEDLVATVPDGRLLELPGGHACHLEHMDRFLAELDRHLSERAVRHAG